MDDVIIIGGSFAGLSAATQLGRARRKTLVLDTSLPRNRFAPAAHGVIGHDGRSPWEIRKLATEQLERYKSVRIQNIGAASAEAIDGGFRVTLDDGSVAEAKKLILAYGVKDHLPNWPGVAESWGKSLMHCPYCHGFELADRPLGGIVSPDFFGHAAALYREWTDDLTMFSNGAAIDAETLAEIEARGVKLVTSKITGIDHRDGWMQAVLTEDGPVPLAGAFIHGRTTFTSDIGTALGCEIEQGPFGQTFVVDMMKMTSVPGVYAAGDITRPNHNLTLASGDGVLTGVGAHQSMVFAA